MVAWSPSSDVHRSSDITVPPTEFPVSIDSLKLRVRYGGNDYDEVFQDYVSGAVQTCQDYQWAQYCTATYVDSWDRFLNPLLLMRGPVKSVTSVTYTDTGGNLQTLVAGTDYSVDTNSVPCRIVPAYSKWWPATRGYLKDVQVTYIAGYGRPGDVPQDIRNAILLRAASLYESCDSTALESTINSLLDKKSFRVFY